LFVNDKNNFSFDQHFWATTMSWKPERPLGLCPKSHKNHQIFNSFYLVQLNKHDRQIKELDLCCHLLLPKQRAASLSCT